METVANQFVVDYKIHECKITIKHRIRGTHRTFRIRNQTKGNLAGKKILSVFVGSDNQSDYDYAGFAFVTEDGQIKVWRSKETTEFFKYAEMIRNPAAHAELCEYSYSRLCCKCGKELTNPESIEAGIGPECSGRRRKSKKGRKAEELVETL